MRTGLLTGLLATNANAFVSPRLSVAHQVRPSQSAIALSNHDETNHKAAAPDVLRNAAAIFAVTCGLLYPSDSFAMNENAFQSSTMTVAEAIRTMDFSLPSSYDTIVDVAADSKEELTQETVRSAAGTAAKKQAAPKKEASPKKKAEKKEAAPKKVAMTKAEREEAAAAAKEAKAKEDAEKQKEIDAKIKADREKRIAARKAAQEEKEAAEAKKAEAAYKDVKFVDTSMPTY